MRSACTYRQHLCILIWLTFWNSVAISTSVPESPDQHLQAIQNALTNQDSVKAESLIGAFIQNYQGAPEVDSLLPQLKLQLWNACYQNQNWEACINDAESLLRLKEIPFEFKIEISSKLPLLQLHQQNFDAAIQAFKQFQEHTYPFISNLNEIQSNLLSKEKKLQILQLANQLRIHDYDTSFIIAYLDPLKADSSAWIANQAQIHHWRHLYRHEDFKTSSDYLIQHCSKWMASPQLIALQLEFEEIARTQLQNGQPLNALLYYQCLKPFADVQLQQLYIIDCFKQNSLENIGIDFPLSFKERQYWIHLLEEDLSQFRQLQNYDLNLQIYRAQAFYQIQAYLPAANLLSNIINHANLEKHDISVSLQVQLIQAWLQAQQWQQAINDCEDFIRKYSNPASPQLAKVYFYLGTAFHQNQQSYQAELHFRQVYVSFPEDPLAHEAHFLEAICLLEQGLHREAIDALQEIIAQNLGSEVEMRAQYWSAMAHYFEQNYDQSLKVFLAYQQDNQQLPHYAQDIPLRIALIYYAQANFEKAEQYAIQFTQNQPDNQQSQEAYLLLGDISSAKGNLLDAIKFYEYCYKESTSTLAEEALLRTLQCKSKLQDYEGIKVSYDLHLQQFPLSLRIAESSVYFIQSLTEQEQLEIAQEHFWSTFNHLGHNIKAIGVEAFLLHISKIYSNPKILIKTIQERIYSLTDDQLLKRLRLEWLERSLSKSLSDKHRPITLDLIQYIPARIAIDWIHYYKTQGKFQCTESYYREILKWHPNCPEIDQIYFGLAEASIHHNHWEQAQEDLNLFFSRTPHSNLAPQAKWLNGLSLQGMHKFDEAQEIFHSLLSDRSFPRQLKPQVLNALADIYQKIHQPEKALVCYERIYLSYANHGSIVAEAYWKRGQLLEQLGLNKDAMEVYRELIDQPQLKNFEATNLAYIRLQREE